MKLSVGVDQRAALEYEIERSRRIRKDYSVTEDRMFELLQDEKSGIRNMTREEFARVVTWIDANAPYYGMYEGKRNLKWQTAADFRPVPK